MSSIHPKFKVTAYYSFKDLCNLIEGELLHLNRPYLDGLVEAVLRPPLFSSDICTISLVEKKKYWEKMQQELSTEFAEFINDSYNLDCLKVIDVLMNKYGFDTITVGYDRYSSV